MLEKLNERLKVCKWSNLEYYLRASLCMPYFISLFHIEDREEAYREFSILTNTSAATGIGIYMIMNNILEDKYECSDFIRSHKEEIKETLNYFLTGKEMVPIPDRIKETNRKKVVELFRNILEYTYLLEYRE